MAHSSELRWAQASQTVSGVAKSLVDTVQDAEERYQELLEAYAYAGGTDLGFAEMLFHATTGGQNTPTPGEIAMAADLRNAMVAAHALFTAMDAAVLRRMS